MEQIGLCFPRRFPQEMLSDMAESEELQRQFGLFQLQERDRRLLEPGSDPGEVSMLAGWGGRGPPAFLAGIRGPSRAPLVSPCPGAGAGPGGRCAGGGGAGAVPALLARVPVLLHG